jgi:hypothetical protein
VVIKNDFDPFTDKTINFSLPPHSHREIAFSEYREVMGLFPWASYNIFVFHGRRRNRSLLIEPRLNRAFKMIQLVDSVLRIRDVTPVTLLRFSKNCKEGLDIEGDLHQVSQQLLLKGLLRG